MDPRAAAAMGLMPGGGDPRIAHIMAARRAMMMGGGPPMGHPMAMGRPMAMGHPMGGDPRAMMMRREMAMRAMMQER